jgi:mono/diheme cytochrome c family protein
MFKVKLSSSVTLLTTVFFIGTFWLSSSSVVFGKGGTETVVKGNVEMGKKVYESRCAICHNSKGDGNGAIGIVEKGEVGDHAWSIYPRDFTTAVFKFRSTPTGCLPAAQDLEHIISNGILRSGMPSHHDLSNQDIASVVEYLKTFSPRWQEEQSTEGWQTGITCKSIIAVKPKWVGSADSVNKGEALFNKMKCLECHGKEGKGDGPKSQTIKDDAERPILPFNFTKGALKRGSTPENIYMTFTTGLDGSGMPSYGDSLNEEERWNLVSYTLKLMKNVK